MATTKPFTNLDFAEALAKLRGYKVNQQNLCGTSSDTNDDPTPQELNTLYSKGYIGASPEYVEVKERKALTQFVQSFGSLYDVFGWAKGKGMGKRLMPYQAALGYDPSWGGDESQTVGSCVSHCQRNAAMVDYGCDVAFGETEWKGRICTENIYRHRGYNNHGWWCSKAAKTVMDNGPGGLLYRKKYTNGRETVDLTSFSSATERWASNGSAGMPDWLQEIEQQNQVNYIFPINTLEEYWDALWLGFGISACSGYGFSNTCDQYGVATQRGSWAHAMAHVGGDSTEWAISKYGGLGLIMQSWGRWNNQNGKRVPPGFGMAPIGSFFVRGNDVKKIIKANDLFAVCQVDGWDRKGPVKRVMKSSNYQDRIKHRTEELDRLAA